MNIPASLSRLKDFCHPREVIAYAVWACHRFALSTADVDDLLAERGVIVSREAVRHWVNHCGQHLRDCIRRDRPRPNDKWHMDEAVITIRGQKHWLWRAIDANGDVLDILVQTRRDARTAKRFFQRLITQFGEPRVVVTDKLRSYIKPIKALASEAVFSQSKPSRTKQPLRSLCRFGQPRIYLEEHTDAGIFLPSCLIPRFDGAICSLEWKEALWDKYVTAAPRTISAIAPKQRSSFSDAGMALSFS